MSSTARKATPRKLHLKLAAVVFMALYLPLGYLFLDAVYPSLETPSQILTSLILPAPVFLLIAGWLWIETRLKHALLPALPNSPMPPSLAQQKRERRASLYMVLFAVFISCGALLPSIIAGTVPGLTAAAPMIVWGFLFRIYGMKRMRFGAILTLSPNPHAEKDIAANVQSFMAGYILDQKKGDATLWTVDITADRTAHPPMLRTILTGHPNDPTVDLPEILTFSLHDNMVLLGYLTGDADPYRLSYQHFRHETVNLEALSAHQKITCLKNLSDARRKMPLLFGIQEEITDSEESGAPSSS